VARNVLIVDDEPGILEIAAAYLKRDGYVVRLASTGRTALEVAEAIPPDLIVLDLRLPDIPGEEVCARLRRTSAVPIIMLTAKSGEEDCLRGLALGADDYLVKPFSPRELVARVRAILRRSDHRPGPPADLLIRDGGRLEVDLAGHEVRVDGRVVALTEREFGILAVLARAPGRVFSREDLMESLQGPEGDAMARTVDAHVKNLRRKLDAVGGDAGGYVATVYGAGYRLQEGRRS
jgi:DNA-binding response OmpR family regulator